MKKELLDLLRCPVSGQRVRLEDSASDGGEISAGWLISACGRYRYPILEGIPRFVPADNYACSFGFQWNIHRKTQLDSFTGVPVSKDRLFAVSGWPEDLRGERILEAGSGAGRFTEVLLQTGAEVFSFDYSSAVDANRLNNGHLPNVRLFQGDIFNIPLPKRAFNKVMCLGVLQHTPDPERAFISLAQCVMPGGELVIDVYREGLAARLQWKYLLRPVTKRMDKEALYQVIASVTPRLMPFTRRMRMLFGRAGARLSPIVEYSDLGLSPALNRDWAILDTFDMYSPAHDHPQSVKTVRRWFSDSGFVDVVVQDGPNGVIGRGKMSMGESEDR
jgi:SAM-dependent methyltransferase